jgi:hypothetical protein
VTADVVVILMSLVNMRNAYDLDTAKRLAGQVFVWGHGRIIPQGVA